MNILFLALILNFSAHAANWRNALSSKGVNEVNLCGSSEIQHTRRSLAKHFIVNGKGFLFTGLISHDRYWEILKTMKKAEADKEIENIFRSSHLWQISPEGTITDLGLPSKIDLRYKSTVKDCVNGAEKTIGGTCTDKEEPKKIACCSEKFTGPTITWTVNKKDYVLFYSPDPSVRLRVPDERLHRFCHAKDKFKI